MQVKTDVVGSWYTDEIKADKVSNHSLSLLTNSFDYSEGDSDKAVHEDAQGSDSDTAKYVGLNSLILREKIGNKNTEVLHQELKA